VRVRVRSRDWWKRRDNEVWYPFSHAQIPCSTVTSVRQMSESDELAAIRAARLNQLQQSGAVNNGQNSGSSEEAEKRRAEEQLRRDLLASALEPAARERRTYRYCLSRRAYRVECVVQCPASHLYHPPDRIRSNQSSCEWHKRGSSEDGSASNSSSTSSNRCVLCPF
jgi:Double-stranded DNA-binding domain